MEEAAALPALLLDRSYSRAFEREADDGARVLLARTGTDAEPFRALLARLARLSDDGGWLSTHPGMAERLQRMEREI